MSRMLFTALFCLIMAACNPGEKAVVIEKMPNATEHRLHLEGNDYETISECLWEFFNHEKSERVLLGKARRAYSLGQDVCLLYRYGSEYIIKAEPKSMGNGMVSAPFVFYKSGEDYSFCIERIENVFIGKYEWDPFHYELEFDKCGGTDEE